MAINGSIWVDGADLHYLSSTGVNWKGTGVLVGASVGVHGSIWIDGTTLHYIDASGNDRTLHVKDVGVNAHQKGSIWIDGALFHWIDNQATSHEAYWHSDVAHSDAHTNVAAYGDYPYKGGYNTTPHYDTHTDVLASSIPSVSA